MATAPLRAAGAHPAQAAPPPGNPAALGCAPPDRSRPLTHAPQAPVRAQALAAAAAAAAHAAACSGRADSAAALRPPSQLPALGRPRRMLQRGARRPQSTRSPDTSEIRLWAPGAKCNPNSILPNPAQINTHKHSHRRRCDPRLPRRIPAVRQGRARDSGRGRCSGPADKRCGRKCPALPARLKGATAGPRPATPGRGPGRANRPRESGQAGEIGKENSRGGRARA